MEPTEPNRADQIRHNLGQVRAAIDAARARAGRGPGSVGVIAVSKTWPPAAVEAALAAGQVAFGENRIQELAEKSVTLAATPAQWHMIGSIQTNKVRLLLRCPNLLCVHSLDRLDLARALHKELARPAADGSVRSLDCLVEVNAGRDPAKHGLRPEDVAGFVRAVEATSDRITIRGLMTMAPLVDGDALALARAAFRSTRELRDALRSERFARATFDVLSMGMSGDYEVAIEEGATLVRVGSAIFGARAP